MDVRSLSSQEKSKGTVDFVLSVVSAVVVTSWVEVVLATFLLYILVFHLQVKDCPLLFNLDTEYITNTTVHNSTSIQ